MPTEAFFWTKQLSWERKPNSKVSSSCSHVNLDHLCPCSQYTFTAELHIYWMKKNNKTRNDKLLHNSVWKILPGLQAEFNFPGKWCVYLKILLKAEGFVCVHETKFLLSVIIKEKNKTNSDYTPSVRSTGFHIRLGKVSAPMMLCTEQLRSAHRAL